MVMSKIEVRKITYSETFSVRSTVLRPGKPITTCFFLGDDADDTTHFGLYLDKKLLGVASVFKSENENFEQKNQFQLRGMAVLSECQGFGFGKVILEKVCKFVETKKAAVLWFNARENAIQFYQNYGFSSLGSTFEIPEIGTHILMHRYFID